MFPPISTAWCVFWLVNIIHVADYSKHSGLAVFTAWFIIGWLPPIFYKLMAIKWVVDGIILLLVRRWR